MKKETNGFPELINPPAIPDRRISTLADIQAQVKAPKNQVNAFGKYKYRKAEDILEAVKPVICPLGFWVTLTDDIVEVGGRIYVKSTATLTNGTDTYSTSAFAREDEIKKGMDSSQVTGASSSYARKYALNGLFAIDDTQDADDTNEHKKDQDEIGDDARDFLHQLLENSTYDERHRVHLRVKIDAMKTSAEFEKAKVSLQDNQLDINGVVNPSQKDINRHINKLVKN